MTRSAPADPACPPLLAALAALAALLWLVAGQFGHGPWKADEAYSFGLVLGMLDGGHWIVPTLAGEPFMEKPPLMYWLGAGFARLFSAVLPLHVGARGANVACAIVAFTFVWLAAREVGERARPWQAVLLLAGAPAWLYASRFLIADVGLVAWQAVATYGAVRLLRRGDGTGAATLALAIGAGMMTKGLVSVAANGVALLGLLALPRFRAVLTGRNLAIGAAVVLPWLLAWPIALAMASPDLFLAWFWDNNVGRFLGLNGFAPPSSAETRLSAAALLLPVLPIALLALWRERDAWLASPGAAAVAMALGWAFVLGTAAQSRGVYWLPALVPLSVIGASRRPAEGLARTAVRLVTVAVAIAVVAMALARHFAGEIEREDLRIALAGPVQPWLVLAALLGCVAYLSATRRVPTVARSAALAWVLGLTFAWTTFVGLFERGLEQVTGFEIPFRSLAQVAPHDADCVASANLGEGERALLQYYAGLRTVRVERAPLAAGGCRFLLAQLRDGPGRHQGVDGAGVPVASFARPGDRLLRFELLARAPARTVEPPKESAPRTDRGP